MCSRQDIPLRWQKYCAIFFLVIECFRYSKVPFSNLYCNSKHLKTGQVWFSNGGYLLQPTILILDHFGGHLKSVQKYDFSMAIQKPDHFVLQLQHQTMWILEPKIVWFTEQSKPIAIPKNTPNIICIALVGTQWLAGIQHMGTFEPQRVSRRCERLNWIW
jgi:hypothetical protein